VKFSEYDSVFDEDKGAPEMVFNPKDDDDGPSDSAIDIDESTTGPVTMDGIEDLDAPPSVEPKVESKVDERIKDDDVVILE